MLRDTLEQVIEKRFDRFQMAEAKLAEVKSVMNKNIQDITQNHQEVEYLEV